MKGPIRNIPPELLDEFTMGGKIPVVDRYFDDDWEQSERTFSTTDINSNLEALKNGTFQHYNGNEQYIIPTLLKYVKGKNVLVVGSVSPAIESVCVYGEAKSVSTLEYNKIKCDDERIKTYTYLDGLNKKFDVIVSYSSFEHSGLSRYGDEIDPNADLKAMEIAKLLLNEDGLLVLAVPFGKDKIEWNAHRVYGEHRWPKLVYGWEIVETCPRVYLNTWECNILQPIFVLRRK